MDDQIEIVMDLAGVTRDNAENALKEKGNIVDAVSSLMNVPKQIGAPKEKRVDEAQEFFTQVRKTMESLTESVHKGFTSSNQSDSSEQVCLKNLHEEMVQQNNCSDECHLPSQELVAEKQETVCHLSSEYSCDLQLNAQT